MKNPSVTIANDDSTRLTALRDSISSSIRKLENNLLETVKDVGGAVLEADEILEHDPIKLRAWVESELNGCMSYSNSRKWMKYVQVIKRCPALEFAAQGQIGVAARTVFASALLQDRISSDTLETLFETLPSGNKITQLDARNLVKKFEALSSVTVIPPTTATTRVLKDREPTEFFDLNAVDLERAKRENPSLAAALEEAEQSPVLPGDPRLIDLINGLGGWDEFAVWLAAFKVSSDPDNPPTPNPPRLAKRFVLVDENGRGTRKALKLFSLLIQAAQVLDMSL